MYFSVGILYSAKDFLKLVEGTPGIDQKFPDLFRTFSVASPRAILDVSQECEWVRLNLDGYLEVTPKGQKILGAQSAENALRWQIKHLIDTYAPPWAPLLSRGRAEAMRYLRPNVQQCLREADLLTSLADEVISWWDALAQATWKQGQDNKLETGRRGERLSLTYEQERTKQEPVWKAIESNLCGYDILSVINEKVSTPLRIEVKASNSTPSAASFHVTRNEWAVAQTSENYVFHLWALQPKPRLFVVEVDEISSHVPENQGAGEWESSVIPFSAVTPHVQVKQEEAI